MPFRYNLSTYYTQRNRVKEIRYLLLSTLLVYFSLFFFTGCEDKKVEDASIPVENSTKMFIEKDKNQHKEKKKETMGEENSILQTSIDTLIDTFTLSDMLHNKYTLTVSNQKIAFHNIDQSIVILNFFSTWCSSCLGEIPYLSDLKKKYKKKIFIAGVLVNDEQDNDALKQFIDEYDINYFISNSKQNDIFASKVIKELQLPENFSIPLTVICKDGNYYTHYEGAVPIEMIDHDLQQIIK